MTICQVCQKENPAGAEYCEDCGAALSAPAPTPVGAGVSSAGASTSGAPASPSTPSIPATPSTPATPAVPSPPTVPPSSSSSAAAAAPDAPTADGASGASGPTTAPSTGQNAASATAQGAAPAAPSTPSAAGSQAQARLVAVRYGAPTGDEIPLLGQRLIVGRFDPETGPVDVDLTAMDAGGHISRQHGELYREGEGSWTVRDLGSTNGVFVKGVADASFGPRITAPRSLNDGDEVTFGNARFIFKST